MATKLAVAVGRLVQLLDCDVEEPRAHLFISPTIEKTETVSTPVPVVKERFLDLYARIE